MDRKAEARREAWAKLALLQASVAESEVEAASTTGVVMLEALTDSERKNLKAGWSAVSRVERQLELG